jgi:PAS domain S-box-containing protein
VGKQSERKRRDLRKSAEASLANNRDNVSNTDLQRLIHELEVHQIELEMQNEELRRTQLELEEAHNKYVDLYDFAPAGHVTLNEKGIILELNLAAAALLGVQRSNLVQQPFSLYVAEENQNLFSSYRNKLLETTTRQTCTLKILRKDKTHFYCQLEGIAVFDDKGKFSHFRLAILDITPRKHAEEALQENLAHLYKKNRYERIISAITQSVHSSIDLQEILEKAAESMSKNIDIAENISIYIVEGEEAVLKTHRGYTDWYINRVRRIPYPKGFTWKTIMEGKAIYCANVEQDTVIGPAGREMGTKSYLSMPIKMGDKTVGAVNINSLEKNAFDEEELKLLEIVAQQIETAINNAKHAEALRESEEKHRHLFENVPTGVYRTTPDGRILMANPALVRMLGYSSFDDLASRNLEKEGFDDNLPRSKFKELLEKEGEVVGLESNWVRHDGTLIHVLENARAIRGEGGTILYYEGTVEDITERKSAEEALRKNVARLSKKNRYETIIRNVIESVHSSINLKEVLENAVDSMIKNIVDVDNVFISLVEGKAAVLKAYRGYPTWFIEHVRTFPYPKGPAWKTIIEGKARYVRDVDKNTDKDPAEMTAGTQSYLSMRIRVRGKSVGVININSLKKNAFDEEELQLLEVVAHQIATAMNNAKQVDELRASEERLRFLVEGVTDYAIFMLDTEGNIASWNMGAERIKGYKAEEALGKHFSIFYDKEDKERGKPEHGLKVATEEGRFEDEGWRLRKDGIRFWANVVIASLKDEAGQLSGFAKVTRDITERKHADEMLKKSKEELELRVVERTKKLAETNEELKKEIAWHKWADKTLRASEERYRALYDENPSMYFTVNREGKVLSLNYFGSERLGFSTAELIGQSILNIIYEDDKKGALEKLEECFRNPGEIVQWEYRKLHKDGRILWSRETARAIQNTDGNVVVLVVSDDITDRKRMEEALHRHMEILDLANDTIVIRDLNDLIIYWNQGAEWTYGWTKEEALGENIYKLLQTEFPKPLEEIKELLYSEEYWEGEIIHTKRDGARIIVASRWTLQWGTERKPLAVLEISNDITERRRTEDTLKEQKNLYEAIINAQSDVGECFLVIEDDRIIYSNEACAKITGYCPADLTALPSFFDLIVPEHRVLTRNNLNRILLGQKAEDSYEISILDKDGKEAILEIAVRVIRVDKKARLIVIGRDVTERKRAKEALEKSEESLRIALEGASLGNWDWEIDTDKLTWSRRCSEMFGLSPDTVMSYEAFLSALHPDDRARTDQGVRDALENRKNYDIEYRTIWPDGSIHWIHARGLVIYDAYRRPRRMTGVTMDITQRKLAEEQIKTSLREKEVLLKEIHHRVKNNLQIISSLLNLQTRHTKEEVREEFKESQNRIKSMALIHEILYQSGNLAGVDFAKYAKSLSNHLLHSYGADSRIKVEIEADDVLLGVDKSVPCGLIINELVSNSLKHAFPLGKNGEIRIALRCLKAGENDPSDYLYLLTLSDNGIGFPKDCDFRESNSLGLRLVCSLARQLDGQIELDGSSGTEFRITFSP